MYSNRLGWIGLDYIVVGLDWVGLQVGVSVDDDDETKKVIKHDWKKIQHNTY